MSMRGPFGGAAACLIDPASIPVTLVIAADKSCKLIGLGTYSSIPATRYFPVALHGVGRQCDDGNPAHCAVERADGAQGFQSVHFGHVYIHQDDVEFMVLDFVHGFNAIIRNDHLVS